MSLSAPAGDEDRDLWRGDAFGIRVVARAPIPHIVPGGAAGTSRCTRWELVSTEALERFWRPHEASRLLERRFPDGQPMMTIDRHDELGYRIWAPRHGRHLVSRDGLLVRSALPRVPAWRWQRLFFAQVLPLAASLQGLELFHASAVALDGEAFALIAASGGGKTSVAAHLIAAGGALVTDDVMALEAWSTGVLAHPGAHVANVDGAELKAMTKEGRERLGRVLGEDVKVQVEPEIIDGPIQLRAVYFLERNADAEEITIVPSDPPDPRLLLASSFISYLATAEHLTNHLDVCARIARSVGMFRLLVPRRASAREVAATVGAHAHDSRREHEAAARA